MLSKPLHRLAPLACLSALLATAACGDMENGPPPAPGPAGVTAVTLSARTVDLTWELPGRVAPFLVAEVRPQVSGIVTGQSFREGGRVDAGQMLYRIDAAAFRAEYDSARATLNRAEAALGIARQNAERAGKLVGTDVISRQEHENILAMLRQAEADVAVAEANLASAKVDLDYTEITAPISGRIGKSSVTVGALVTANQQAPLVTVQQLEPVYVDLTQSAEELLELRRQLETRNLMDDTGVPVTILLEDDLRYEHAGRLLFTEISVDPSTGSFLMRVEVPNPDNNLLPGMYVRALITYGRRGNAILAPQQGISRDPKGNATAMVVVDGKVERRAVAVSRTLGDQWLVENGLEAGDRIVVEGLQRIQPGMPVEVTDAAAVTEE